MILEKAHIENFGKLSNKDFLFKPGLNIILNDNGSGKSTLAAFIKAIFYSFEGDRKISPRENERMHYRPWQGGKFGGYIEFSIEDRRYRAIRYFGERKALDSFMLVDPESLEKIDEYSENLGEELFGIDLESFEKTLFFGENSCDIDISSVVHGKISDLSFAREDINEYTSAMSKLNDAMNFYSGSRKTGEIYKKRIAISEITGEILEEKEIREKYDELKSLDAENVALKDAISKQINEKKLKQDEISKTKDQEIKLIEYNEKNLRLKKAEENLLNLAAVGFNEKYENEHELLKKLDLETEKYKTFFENGIVSREYVRERQEHIINKLSLFDNGKENIEENTKEYDIKEDEESADNSFRFLYFLAVIISLAAIGLSAYFIYTSKKINMFNLLPAINGIILFLVFTFIKQKNSKSDIDEIEKIEENGEKDIHIKTPDMEYEDERCVGLIEKYYTVSGDFNIDTKENALEAMKVLNNLMDHIEKYENLIKLRDAASNIDTARLDLNSFIDENSEIDFTKTREELKKESLSDISEELRVLHEKENDLIKKSIEFETEFKSLEASITKIQKKKEEKILLLSELTELQKKEQVIKMTIDALEKAKSKFSENYRKPVHNAFLNYYRAIEKNPILPDLRMDNDFNISIIENASEISPEYMSRGFIDIISLARRGALIDAMYEEGECFIVLDDPFTNLDDKHIEAAISLRDKIAEKYQIIYFTCHKSRV